MPDISSSQLTFAGVFLFVMAVLGVLTAIQAIINTRTSQGAIAWTVILLTLPVFAVPAYWIFGRSRFRGYLDVRRDRSRDAVREMSQLMERMAPFVDDMRHHYGEARVLKELAQLPFLRGNDTQLLINGRATFDAIFEAIESAKEYVLIEFFIIHDDQMGGELKKRLIAKAIAGVRVFVLYDDVGSTRISNAYIQDLQDAGIQVTGMKTTQGWGNRFQLNFRNHRKIVVIDGHTTFIGGHNVGDEYVGKHPKLTPWRDTHVRISGPAALAAQLAFAEDWHWAMQTTPRLNWQPQPSPKSDETVFILPSGPADSYETCGLFFTHAINSATRSIWIATPYFVPDEGIITALQLAALRGVDVRILIPGLPDKWAIKSAAMSYLPQVIESGVQVYEYEAGFMHQKVMLVDHEVAAVGTANFDNRSFRLNFEVTALVVDHDFAAKVGEMLQNDFDHSRLVDDQRLLFRPFAAKVLSQITRLFSPIL